MSTVSILGAGNIAWAFGQRLKSKGYDIREVCSRDAKAGGELANLLGAVYCGMQKKLDGKSDYYLIAVNDGAIIECMPLLTATKGLVVHFSGSTSLHAITQPFRAVLWPLRSISKGKDPEWKSMNIIMESDGDLASVHALELIQDLGAKAVRMDERKRKQAHLIAVILNNFSNHLLHMADVLCQEESMDRKIFDDLLSAALLGHGPALEKQTGPAVRGDQGILERQMKMLAKHPEFQDIYRSMSESIKKTAGK